MDAIKKKMEKLANETNEAEMRIAHFEDIKAANELEVDIINIIFINNNVILNEIFILGWEVWGSVEECAEENPGKLMTPESTSEALQSKCSNALRETNF